MIHYYYGLQQQQRPEMPGQLELDEQQPPSGIAVESSPLLDKVCTVYEV